MALPSASTYPAATRGHTGLDLRHLRRCLGRFTTGVTVVSYRSGEGMRGVTVNSFTSVSLDPPLVLVSIASGAKAAVALRNTPFTVNVLAADQLDLAWTFAGRPVDGARVRWDSRVGGVAHLRGSAAWFECAPWDAIDAGDHVLFLGAVVAHDQRQVEPLLFQSGKFRALGTELGAGPGRQADPLSWIQHRLHAQRLTDDGARAVLNQL
jgi:flavin reductase (DIM6/NTAB) family NADH-FMN oxidoreductase RutF